jgi:hypothetical protein
VSKETGGLKNPCPGVFGRAEDRPRSFFCSLFWNAVFPADSRLGRINGGEGHFIGGTAGALFPGVEQAGVGVGRVV